MSEGKSPQAEESVASQATAACSSAVCPRPKKNADCSPLVEGVSGLKTVPIGSGTLLNIFNLKRYGYNFYSRKQYELKSSVFQMSLYGERTVVLDWKGITSIRSSLKVVKEPGFGMLIFNQEILPDHLPAVFSNGEEHEIRKIAVMKFAETVDFNRGSDFITSLVRSELLNLNSFDCRSDFEKALCSCIGKVISTLFLGQPLVSEDMEVWVNGTLISKRQWFINNTKCLNAFKTIYSSVKSSSRVVEFIRAGAARGLSEDQLIKELVFMIVFNAYGALKNLSISCVAHIRQLNRTDLEGMQAEAKSMYRSAHLPEDPKTPLIEGFVLEILRLFPPAPSVYARVTEEFVLESAAGNFLIPKGQLLHGFIYTAQRDDALFVDPHSINIHRYETNSSLRQYILSFGGIMDVLAGTSNHKCPGQTLGLKVLKALVANLVFCDIDFQEAPLWTGHEITRLAASDKPLRVRKFFAREIPQIDPVSSTMS